MADSARPFDLRVIPIALLAIVIVLPLTAPPIGGLGAVIDPLLGAAAAALWVASAWGWGLVVDGWQRYRAAFAEPSDPLLALGTGMMLLLIIDQLLGRLGIFSVGAPAPLVVHALGVLALLSRRSAFRPLPALAPVWLLLALPIGTLLVAAAIAPGVLWRTEFGGYDALSYHLSLPVEWGALGSMHRLDHVAYSGLPSYVEAAFLDLMTLTGDRFIGAYAAQMLHAVMAIVTALLAARLLPRDRWHGAAAAIIVIATPWTIVVGSLAYNEMALTLGLVTGWHLTRRVIDDRGSWRDAIALGAVIGASIGAKATGVGFVALPLGFVVLLTGTAPLPVRGARLALAIPITVGVLAPWLVQNALSTGNPVFPLLTGTLPGPWLPDQAARWSLGHQGSGALAPYWDEWLRFGLGPAPPPETTAVWSPQWSITPALTLLAIGVLLLRSEERRRAVAPSIILIGQLIFWGVVTHQKSRFLIPTVVPCAVLIGAMLEPWIMRRAGARVIGVALALAACLPTVLFLGERGGGATHLIGAHTLFTGRAGANQTRPDDLTWWMNDGLPDDARVLLIGDATPFYYLRDNFTWSTVWDRTVADAWDALRAAPDDAPYTHVVVNTTMLSVWLDAGWLDPRLEPRAVLRDARALGPVIAPRDTSAPTGWVLIEITRDASAVAEE